MAIPDLSGFEPGTKVSFRFELTATKPDTPLGAIVCNNPDCEGSIRLTTSAGTFEMMVGQDRKIWYKVDQEGLALSLWATGYEEHR